jgi:hypothetical protein
MSDQATGGDGSVRFSLDVQDVRTHESMHLESGRLQETGVDRSGAPGKDWFTVSIEAPQQFDGDAAKYLDALKGEGVFAVRCDPREPTRIYFNLPIETMNNDQVRLSWGSSEHVLPPDPNGTSYKAR